MTRRPGLSLTEVLVALFIMGIGTIAILTLFPLGALNMAQAFRDDRTTQCSAQASSYFRWYWQDKLDLGPASLNYLDKEPMFAAMDDPGITGGASISNTDTNPSYPIVVDPMGFEPRLAKVNEAWVGDGGPGKTPDKSNLGRRTLNLTKNNPLLALRTCTLLDGLGYDPATGGGRPASSVERDMRYNWLWVVRRPNNSQRNTVEMTVVVFDRRAHMYVPPGAETVHTPTAAGVGQTRVAFTFPDVPVVQRGSWLMDATVTTFDSGNVASVPPSTGAGLRPGVRNANFYRVVSVTDLGPTVGIEVELETPLKDDTVSAGDEALARTAVQPNHRRFVHLNGVAEVFVQNELVVGK